MRYPGGVRDAYPRGTGTGHLHERELGVVPRVQAAELRIPIVVDTREQLPFCFSSGGEVSRGTLETGDYSLVGFEDRVAIERKSLEDLVGSLTGGRDRFFRELERLARYYVGAVVVEASLEDVARHRYRSNASPKSIFGSSMAICCRYCPVYFAGSRAYAERLCEGLLRRFFLDHVDSVANGLTPD